MPRGQCHRHGADRPCTCAMGNLYRFIEPVILYQLTAHWPAHGYELAGELNRHALTDAQIDRAALYRTLQRLESNGHVTSTWDTTGGGPARHTYQITDSGREHLWEWRAVLGNLARSMEAFVGAVDAAREKDGATPLAPVETR